METLCQILVGLALLVVLIAICLTLNDIRHELRKSRNLLWVSLSGGDLESADLKDAA